MNWTTKNIYIDTDTGELIPKQELENYSLKKRIKQVYVHENNGTVTYTNECIRNKQLKLNFNTGTSSTDGA